MSIDGATMDDGIRAFNSLFVAVAAFYAYRANATAKNAVHLSAKNGDKIATIATTLTGGVAGGRRRTDPPGPRTTDLPPRAATLAPSRKDVPMWNLPSILSDAIQYGSFAAEEVAALQVDAAQIKAKQPASVTLPPIPASIEGVAGVFSGSITFTPNP